ncbi:Fe-Mn family superoxide dismutase [Cytobacillus eiseniae]|uniref:superoxide dismutase n=1 Tax=Cytobacillus eiseniae TaxID=762947 RepID=A0ABS4RCV2_9BACI|nr:superoxide dismutase [Cytobacillus eiseniae]MBP2240730.1 Fe-Mn family superoxide dismutase [Cytobacillus eiseniae]
MSKLDAYIQDVFKWNKEMQSFLESENVNKNDELWRKMDHFTNIMDGIKQPLNDQSLVDVQHQVDELHAEMESYFSKRQELGSGFLNETRVAVGNHKLPPLPYSYHALEPYISEEIMRLHHNKHHQSYVDGLNKAEKELEKSRAKGDFSLIKHWSRELAFHGSGHYLHTIFWHNMTPNGGGKPTGALLKAIENYFGSFEAFKQQFTEAANQVEGVGWAVLVWSPRAHHLEILQSERHMLLTQWDTIPLLVLDVWEHAYYLQYKNKRTDYVKNWWNLVNWKDVSDRYIEASKLKWKPF